MTAKAHTPDQVWEVLCAAGEPCDGVTAVELGEPHGYNAASFPPLRAVYRTYTRFAWLV